MDSNTVTLQTPIKSGDKEITEIKLRQPNVLALRGISMRQIVDMDVEAVAKLLPRISTPALVEHEINGMDPHDFLQMSMAVASFFLPAGALEGESS